MCIDVLFQLDKLIIDNHAAIAVALYIAPKLLAAGMRTKQYVQQWINTCVVATPNPLLHTYPFVAACCYIPLLRRLGIISTFHKRALPMSWNGRSSPVQADRLSTTATWQTRQQRHKELQGMSLEKMGLRGLAVPPAHPVLEMSDLKIF